MSFLKTTLGFIILFIAFFPMAIIWALTPILNCLLDIVEILNKDEN